MNKFVKIAGVFLGLPVVAAIGMLALGVDVEPKDAGDVEEKVRTKLAVLSVLADAAGSWSEDVPCPGNSLRDGAELPLFSLLQIQEFVGKSENAELIKSEGELGLVSRKIDSSSRLDDDSEGYEFRAIADPGLVHTPLSDFYAAKVVAVLKTDKAAMPKKKNNIEGDFYSGVFEGALRIVNTETGDTICQAAFTAESTDEVKRGFGKTGPQALVDDFKEQLELAQKEALKRLSGANVGW